jgi:shikimate dehydrogenase
MASNASRSGKQASAYEGEVALVGPSVDRERDGVRFAVIGDPIAHSLSPAMHEAALRAAGIPGRYVAVRVESAHLHDVAREFRDGGMRGVNVTIPHKESVIALLDHVSEEARAIGAVNTIVIDGGRLSGFNTDAAGFMRALSTLGGDASPRRSVVFGSGGSARAVAYALARAGGSVAVVSRNPTRAAEWVRALGSQARPVSVSHSAATIREAECLVNATPLGMSDFPDATPLPSGVHLSSTTVVVDLVYGRSTPLLRAASSAGCVSMDGLEMLVQQGAESFRLWNGVEPDVETMRAACLRALEGVITC